MNSVPQDGLFRKHGKEAKIDTYLIFAGIGCAVLAVLFSIVIIYLQRSREKERLLELAEIKHRKKRRRSHERKPKKHRAKDKKEAVKTSNGAEEKKNGHEKASAEALHSAPIPDEVAPTAAKAAASPPTATGGDYINAADLILEILTSSTQQDVDIQGF